MPVVALVTQKTHSNEAQNFTNTTEFAVLHCANVTGNNNKFYCLEIQEDPNTHNCRLFSHYGRLGTSNIYEIRDHDKNGDALTEDRCKVEFDKIIKKKERGKNVKRDGEVIRETYSRVDVVSPSVGSTNICHASDVAVANSNAPMINTDNHDKESGRLIRTMVAENIHNITSSTTMTFTSNGFETPLGPVTEPHLDKATAALDVLRDGLSGDKALDDTDKDVKDANSEYFSLIPRHLSHIITKSDLILTPDDVAAEYDLLDNLRTAVQVGLNANNDNDTNKELIDLAQLAQSADDYNRLVDKFESTKHRNHSQLRGYHVKNIFELDIPSVTKSYEPIAKKLGNIHELFHGTKTANMLSISLKGLIIPNTGEAHVTGRMFGNGVYAASCSTKALNYAVGYWGGSQNRGNAYMLIVNFAMGKEHVATSHLYSGAPKGYDSVWAKSGQALLNDEFIVYNLNQATITHVLELENK